MKKILVVGLFSLPATGAGEQDRIAGLKQLKRLGFDVRVVTPLFDSAKVESLRQFSRDENIPIHGVIPQDNNNGGLLRKFLSRIRTPFPLDGSARVYADDKFLTRVKEQMHIWRPNILWCEFTYAWPTHQCAQQENIIVVTRSQNFEPTHFLEEDGYTLSNYLKWIPKYVGERYAIRNSSIVFSITPDEENRYRSIGAQNVVALPLRNLAYVSKLGGHKTQAKTTLDLFFMGSTYNVAHNQEAAEFLIYKVAPLLKQKIPGKYRLHIFGKQLPQHLREKCIGPLVYHGYVSNILEEISKMDIALAPSLAGAGMQQKIFEPLCLGFPTVVSPRGLAGYTYENGKEVLCADSPEEFADAIISLQDISLQKKIGNAAREKSETLFSQEAFDEIVIKNLIQ